MSGPPIDLSLLSPQEKRQLLEKMLRARSEFHPLSYVQRGMWFLHQLDPHSAAYNTGFSARIRSEVDPAALQRAFQALIDRHAALRTTFLIRDGELRQRIHSSASFSLDRVDASGWRETVLREEVQGAYARPFNLETGPLVRVVLFSRGPADHVLLLVIHHIIFDGWSFWVLLDELRLLYDSARSAIPVSLPRLRADYTDFIDWEKRMVAGPEGERHRGYWENQLGGDLPVLALRHDRLRPRHQVFDGRTLEFRIAPELARQIRELARSEETTTFTVLLAAFQLLLFRHSGQDEILVGSPTTGRSRPEFSEVVGDFVNMVVFRSRPEAGLSFIGFLRQVRRTVLEALDHQDYPFPLLVEKLNSGRNPSHSPIFQASFVFHQAQRSDRLLALLDSEDPGVRVDWGGLILSPYPLSQQAGQFDLTLEMADKGDHLRGTLKFSTALFEDATVRGMMEDFTALLADIASEPSQILSGFSVPAGGRRDVFVL